MHYSFFFLICDFQENEMKVFKKFIFQKCFFGRLSERFQKKNLENLYCFINFGFYVYKYKYLSQLLIIIDEVKIIIKYYFVKIHKKNFTTYRKHYFRFK